MLAPTSRALMLSLLARAMTAAAAARKANDETWVSIRAVASASRPSIPDGRGRHDGTDTIRQTTTRNTGRIV